MKVCLREVPPEEKETLFHLLEKYSYEFSQYDQTSFDDKGLFGYPYLDLYFTQRDRFAYFITADDRLAGFALIHKHKECDRPADWVAAEFFVAYPYRNQGVGTRAMEQIFKRHSGMWHIKYHVKNTASVPFWEKTAKMHASGGIELCRGREDYDDGTESAVLVFETPAAEGEGMTS